MNEEFEDGWADGEGPVQEALKKSREEAAAAKERGEKRSEYEEAFDKDEAK